MPGLRPSVPMRTLLADWMANAENHAARNRAFLHGLDRRKDKAIDRAARRLHRAAFQAIDCTRCANCCRTILPTFTQAEIHEIATYLGVPWEALLAAHLTRSSSDDRLRTRGVPCPFLGRDDRCSIYEVRPASCSDFPHTNRSRFAAAAECHAENARDCPAVFYVIEQMRERGVR